MRQLTEPEVNEICKAHVYGISVSEIAAVMNASDKEITELLESESDRIEQLAEHYKAMEVI